MNYLEKYLRLVWDANHGATKTVFHFDKPQQAHDFRKSAKQNLHVKEARQSQNKLIVEYEKQTETTIRQLRANPQ